MTVGIPGTGIGGLFYLLLVVLMPLREAWRTLRGRSSRARWLEVARHVALAAAIVGGFLATGGVILALLTAAVRLGLLEADGVQLTLDAGGAWSQRALVISLLVLGGVLLGAAGLRVVMRPRRTPREKFDGPTPQPSLP